MNKLLILAVVIAAVSAQCRVYDSSKNFCGNDASANLDCSNYVRAQNGCVDCTTYTDSKCGGATSLTNCFAYTVSQDNTKCTVDCTVADTANSACSTNTGCSTYKYDSNTKKCVVGASTSAKIITFATTLLLVFLF